MAQWLRAITPQTGLLPSLGLAALVALAFWLLLRMSRQPTLAKTLLPIGAALFSVSAQRSWIKSELADLPDGMYRALLVGGLFLIFLGVVGIVVPFSRLRELVMRPFEPPRFRCRAAKESELAQVHELAKQFFGDSIATLETMQRWYRKNSEFVYVVHQSTGQNGRMRNALVGFFEVQPVTKRAAELLEREELTGPTLAEDHIVKRNGKSAAVYLAGVAARGFHAKGWTLAKLDERLVKYRKKGLTIYTRPVTKDGLRLVKKYDFVPVRPTSNGNELSRIYRLNAGADTPD